ncbi:Potassium efflux system KefA protein / Small-conductance mechanosensitive channel [hydrothermal vent metagenome]|uniref:Potassium efflux system KefA protein / Small-conductance mechanosensitive channel n=1 Tax=hydrothermal vent metagenome TaxID=652676 RepID=A0A3B0SFH9_9ZZZZ
MNSEIVQNMKQQALALLDTLLEWAMSPQFYAQIGAIIIALVVAQFAAKFIRDKVAFLREKPTKGKFLLVQKWLFAASSLLRPVLIVTAMALAVQALDASVGASWLVRIAQGIAVINVLYSAINQFITNPMVRTAAIWIGIPFAILQVFGWLDAAINWMESIAIPLGSAKFSLFTLFKGAIAGAVLFWIGRHSNTAGQKAIRQQDALDVQIKELFVKLFQIALFALLAILLMQVLGIPLGSLAILGGAIGIGVGFGLQQIASNFISGMILLFERSMGIGDYIELDNGRIGTLKAINMRSSVLETYDGKEIMIPNETFITEQFINWTRDDPRQRYEVEFSVSYDTDPHKVPPLIAAAVASHPQVLSDPEEPDCELRGFGDSGIEFGVEFWVSGVDDGPNKFSSDILFLVWDVLRDNNIEIPFPRQDIRILGDAPKLKIGKK